MKVHLFGLPISLHRRLKEDSSTWQYALPAGHEFRGTPLTSNVLGTFDESDLRALADGVDEGFTHIVIPASREWSQIKQRFQYDCRIHLSRLREPIRDLTWPILKENLHRIVKMEEDWLARLCPQDTRHALLLPPTVFATNAATSDYWRHCDVYSTERFADAVHLLREVERYHRRPDGQGFRSWIDHHNRRFRSDPSKHGRSALSREQHKAFRFCYELPPGFHYDVTEDAGKAFTIVIGGRSHSTTRCNVNSWGKVWGQ